MASNCEVNKKSIEEKMKDPMTESEMRRLVLAKKLYLHGCSHTFNKDQISRMLAIHHFDITVDMILECIVARFKLRLQQNENYFQGKWKKISKEIVELPLRNQVLFP